jgi:hypothetical protein
MSLLDRGQGDGPVVADDLKRTENPNVEHPPGPILLRSRALAKPRLYQN